MGMDTGLTASAIWTQQSFIFLVSANCSSYILDDRIYEILKASNSVYFMQEMNIL